MQRLRISVAMCTFNGARFLSEQLESIANQIRLPDELIILDDRSTDGSAEVIKSFLNHAPFDCHFNINNHQLGSTKNFEKAMGLCRGEIIALADQDDVWHPEKLSSLADILERDPHIGAVFTNAELIDQDSRSLGKTLWNSYLFNSHEQKMFGRGQGLKVLLKHPLVTGATMAFRSEFLPLALPIPPNHVHDFWIATLIASVSQLAPTKIPLMRYRKHPAQQIGPRNSDSLWQTIDGSRRVARDFYLGEAERFDQIRVRLRDRSATFPPHPYALRWIRQKIRHRKARGCFPESKLLRLPYLVREVATLRYWRYSNGLGSVAKDLLI